MQDWEREDLIGDIEYLYTDGNSLTAMEADLVRWLLDNGWKIIPPIRSYDARTIRKRKTT